MRCRQAERLISADLDSRLPVGLSGDLEAHLADCPSCRSYRAGLDFIQKSAAVCGETTVPPGYWVELSARVRAKIEQEGVPGRSRPPALRGWRWARVGVPAAAAVVMVLLYLFRPGPPSIADPFGSPARLESASLAVLEDPELAGELDGLVSAAIREETGGLSPYELPDLVDDPGFWESLTDEEVSLIDGEIAEELIS